MLKPVRSAALAVLLAGTLPWAGCGGSSDRHTTPTAHPAKVSALEKLERFAAKHCPCTGEEILTGPRLIHEAHP